MNSYNNIGNDILVERAKELECLYLIDEALSDTPYPESLEKITSIIPSGFRNTKACSAIIEFDGNVYHKDPIIENADELSKPIIINDKTRGFIKVRYPKNTFSDGEIVFLDQEVRLINTISKRISETIDKIHSQNMNLYRNSWKAILDLLQKTDHEILLYVCEKMLALLKNSNPKLVHNIFEEMGWAKYENKNEINFPLETLPAIDIIKLSQTLFSAALKSFDDSQIYKNISLWVFQGKTYEFIKVVDKKDSDVKEISKALSRYLKAVKDTEMSSKATKKWLTAELSRRFLTDNAKQITLMHKYISIGAFQKLLDAFICSPKSIGKIGGKATGFFLANQIIETFKNDIPEFENIKIPKTWYISSDELGYLIENNGLDELNEHKYRDIVDIRTSYPRIIQTLKNLKLSPYVFNELNQILDTCEGKPLIIRSSSLLEDQIDTAFSGKYKSLFITNTGTRQERLKQLTEGILEVYASIFNPDSILYRRKRNLIDCSEQMGIMIQEVVGRQVGPYFFPLYAGVAFSNNELRWSPRLKRSDGLLRIVMGLGTRAVDRVGEDFPVIISPGQPNLRVNQSPIELQKYSPQYMDVIDIKNNRFLTMSISEIIKQYGDKLPFIDSIASVMKNDFITEANKFTTDFKSENIVITFDNIINKSPFVKLINSMLSLLKDKLGYPVDIEFASDGENFYLLQCRPQSKSQDSSPAAISPDIPTQDTLFTANKYISNGMVTGINTVVYVNPIEYSKLEKHEDLVSVGRAVSELNSILPRRSFILMGPGRWGSRGDIKLGVPVAYSDINNTSMLIEIAVKKSKYQPELSFGTHFFQDLVEENIKYLPLYPEDTDVIFNNAFFRSSKNSLNDILPQYSYLSDVIKVINIADIQFDKELNILMNADQEKAVAYLENPSNSKANQKTSIDSIKNESYEVDEQGWKWRHFMAEQIAEKLDINAYGVKGIYLFGSTNNCTARLNSDIDLLIHFNGTYKQKEALDNWLNGWSMALSEINYLKTGYKSEGLLDIHYVTDQDIKDKTSYATKIDSVFDPAYLLKGQA
ncbi:PEP/pyruvate-binding domain-containing protein [Herbivorax sp. ANBcel31]|uniref:PEP/pyruvate-binding domain-containing protein n=1 Tax=Herbivorax sp. ANBcel31 TaxID=3069754 RepID=UPI0027B8790F|nr:PEP/pyruvate-binding domain-containing protein [Herbivorax sp. ANBcel31]MDQ2087429.1 PEP/pyruvate-binding domain-containing protein [Herbivorax sp. ANBcel31]